MPGFRNPLPSESGPETSVYQTESARAAGRCATSSTYPTRTTNAATAMTPSAIAKSRSAITRTRADAATSTGWTPPIARTLTAGTRDPPRLPVGSRSRRGWRPST